MRSLYTKEHIGLWQSNSTVAKHAIVTSDSSSRAEVFCFVPFMEMSGRCPIGEKPGWGNIWSGEMSVGRNADILFLKLR